MFPTNDGLVDRAVGSRFDYDQGQCSQSLNALSIESIETAMKHYLKMGRSLAVTNVVDGKVM